MKSLPTILNLEHEDIMQALLYAAWRAEECEIVLAHA
jgi:hypothetical protein